MIRPRAPSVDALAQLARGLGHARAPHEAAEPLVAFFAAVLPATTGLFAAAYEEPTRTRRCVLACTDGEVADASSLPPLPLNDNPASQAIVRGAPVVTGDYQRFLRRQFRVDVGMHKDPRLPESAIAVPLRHAGRIVGTFEIQSPEPHAYEPEDVAFVEAAGGLLAGLVAGPDTKEGKPHAQGEHALARGLVREMLDRITRRANLRPEILRGLGRDLGGTLRAESLQSHVVAFASMGLGELRIASETPDRVVVHGHDLLERGPRSREPTCFVTLGYLEGAFSGVRGREVLGVEIACESQGRHECVFVLALRS